MKAKMRRMTKREKLRLEERNKRRGLQSQDKKLSSSSNKRMEKN